MEREWKRLSDHHLYQPSAKDCAPPSPAEAFVSAARDGDLAAMQKLLARGVDVNAKDNSGGTALYWASFDHLDIVRALLDRGADVNADTPLVVASFGGHLDIVRALLDKGADVNAKDSRDGGTALMAASAQGHLDVVQALLEKGADVNAKGNDGTTALSVAKDDGVKAVLTEAGATP